MTERTKHNLLMKILKNSLWSIALYLVFSISGFIFSGNHKQIIVVVLIATFIITLLFTKYEPQKKKYNGFLLLILPLLLIFIVVSFFSGFKRSLVYLVFVPIVFHLSWVLLKDKKSLLIGTAILITIAIAPVIFIPNIYSYYLNSDAKRNKPIPELGWLDGNKNPMVLSKDKVVVLDFWNRSCAVCFKKFPEFESLYLDYKDNPEIEFYSVNVPLPMEELSTTLKLVDSLNYKYKTIYATSAIETQEKLNISSYPIFMIIKNGQIRFSGFQNSGFNIFVYNSKNEIERLLQE